MLCTNMAFPIEVVAIPLAKIEGQSKYKPSRGRKPKLANQNQHILTVDSIWGGCPSIQPLVVSIQYFLGQNATPIVTPKVLPAPRHQKSLRMEAIHICLAYIA